MTEVLKMVKKGKICQNKGPQGSPVPWDLTKKSAREAGIWQLLNICPRDGIVTLEID